MTQTDYSIIVPAYNEAAWLPDTLQALATAMNAVTLRGEIIVTDNNSTDRTAGIARQHGAQVVFEAINQISRARNAGARVAQGRYLVFVDADTIVSPALLKAALDNLVSGRCIGGGAVVQFADNVTWAVQRTIDVWNLLSRSLRLAAGCFLYCTHEAFEQTGGFSEAVYASEEIWLSRRLRRYGRRKGKRFCIITATHVVSSGRKLRWFSTWQQILMLLMVTFFPVFVRYRRFCGYWYRRPRDTR